MSLDCSIFASLINEREYKIDILRQGYLISGNVHLLAFMRVQIIVRNLIVLQSYLPRQHSRENQRHGSADFTGGASSCYV